MKTPSEQTIPVHLIYAPHLDTELSAETKSRLRDALAEAIEAIQRDAREGMVPEEDLEILLRGTPDCDADCGCEWCKAVNILRAKHPNLFTK